MQGNVFLELRANAQSSYINDRDVFPDVHPWVPRSPEIDGWLAHNKVVVAQIDAELDLLLGIFAPINEFHAPDEFEIPARIREYLTCQAYQIHTVDVDLKLWRRTRWTYLLNRGGAMFGNVDMNTLVSKSVSCVSTFLGCELSPVQLMGMKVAILNVMRDSLRLHSVLYLQESQRPGVFSLIFTPEVKTFMSGIVVDIRQQAASSIIELGKITFTIAPPRNTGQILPDYLRDITLRAIQTVEMDQTINPSHRQYLLWRISRRVSIFQTAWSRSRDVFGEELREGEVCMITLTGRHQVYAESIGFVNVSFSNMHRERMCSELLSWLVYLPMEIASMSASPTVGCDSMREQIASQQRLMQIDGIMQKYRRPGIGVHATTILNNMQRFYLNLQTEIKTATEFVFTIQTACTVNQAIDEALWLHRTSIPCDVPYIDMLNNTSRRAPYHSLELLLDTKRQKSFTVILPDISKQGAAVRGVYTYDEIPRPYHYLLYIDESLNAAQITHNNSLREIFRYIRRQETAHVLRVKNSMVVTQRDGLLLVADDEMFTGGLMDMVTISKPFQNQVLEARLREFGFQINATWDEILGAIVSNGVSLLDQVPDNCDDSHDFIQFIHDAYDTGNETVKTVDQTLRYTNSNKKVWEEYVVNANSTRNIHEFNLSKPDSISWLESSATHRAQLLHNNAMVMDLPRSVTSETRFSMTSNRIVLHDNILTIDPNYFYAHMYITGEPMPIHFAVSELPPQWPLIAHHDGVVPRPRLSYLYFATQPPVFVMGQSIAKMVMVERMDRRPTCINRIPPSDLPLTPIIPPYLTAYVDEQDFYPVTSDIVEPFFQVPFDTDYRIARQDAWRAGECFRGIKTTPSGINYFMLRCKKYMPHFSPFPWLASDVLKHNVQLALHSEYNYVLFNYLTTVTHNYRVGEPPNGSFPAVRVLQEHPSCTGVVEDLQVYWFETKVKNAPWKLNEKMAHKFRHMDIIKANLKHTPAVDRLKSAGTIGGRLLHEEIVTIDNGNGKIHMLEFHINHGNSHAFSDLPEPDVFSQRERVGIRLTTEFLSNLQARRRAIYNIERSDRDPHDQLNSSLSHSQISWNLANLVTAHRLVELLIGIGFSTDQTEWIEYEPSYCTFDGQEMIMQFPNIWLTEAQEERIASFVDIMNPVPFTRVDVVKYPAVRRIVSIYPKRIPESALMFQVKSAHRSYTMSHSDDKFQNDIAMQNAEYLNIHGESIIACDPTRYIQLVFDEQFTNNPHAMGIAINTVKKQFPIRCARYKARVHNISGRDWITRQTVITDVINLDAIPMLPCTVSDQIMRAPCGCSMLNLLLMINCRRFIRELICIVKLTEITSSVYRYFIRAMSVAKMSNDEISQIARHICPAFGSLNSMQREQHALDYPVCTEEFINSVNDDILCKYMTPKTIAFYARRSSKASYNALIERYMGIYLTYESQFDLRMSTPVANCVAWTNMLDFIGVREKNLRIMQFVDGGWDSVETLKNSGRERVEPALVEKLAHATQARDAFVVGHNGRVPTANRLEYNEHENRVRNWKYATELLRDFRSSNDVRAAVAELLEMKNFDMVADSISSLTRCKNFVLLAHRAQRRIEICIGLPEFYLTMSTEIDYDMNMNQNNETYKEVMKFWRQIFVNYNLHTEADRERLMWHVLKDYARNLDGENWEKKMRFIIGRMGYNAKSTQIRLIKMALGNYYVVSKNSIFTIREKDASSASPQLFKLVNKRFVSLSETDEKDIYQGNLIKQHNSNDEGEVRGLHRGSRTMTPTCRFYTHTNYMLVLETGGDTAIRRLLFFPANSVFSETAPHDPEEQRRTRCYPMDANFDSKMRGWHSAQLYILKNCYCGDEYTEIQETIDEKVKFMRDVDVIQSFIDSEFIIHPKLRGVAIPETTRVVDAHKRYERYMQEIRGKRAENKPLLEFIGAIISKNISIVLGQIEYVTLRERLDGDAELNAYEEFCNTRAEQDQE